MKTAVLMALGLWCVPAFAGDLYKWTDENGTVHYSDTNSVGEGTNYATPEINVADPYTPDAATLNSVRIFTTSWCGICRAAKDYLRSRRIAFTEIDVEQNAEGREEYRRLGGRGVPLITVGQHRMTGFSAARLDRVLKASGY